VVCPQCNTANPLDIIYGSHSAEMISAALKGEIALSDTIESSECPAFRCRNLDCAHEWGAIQWRDSELLS